jgi:hypothetical protein
VQVYNFITHKWQERIYWKLLVKRDTLVVHDINRFPCRSLLRFLLKLLSLDYSLVIVSISFALIAITCHTQWRHFSEVTFSWSLWRRYVFTQTFPVCNFLPRLGEFTNGESHKVHSLCVYRLANQDQASYKILGSTYPSTSSFCYSSRVCPHT